MGASSSPRDGARDGSARLLKGWMTSTAGEDLRRPRASVAEHERGRAWVK
jgi:hypothetical protein